MPTSTGQPRQTPSAAAWPRVISIRGEPVENPSGVSAKALAAILQKTLGADASFTKSSKRNRHRPAANTTNGSSGNTVVQDAGIERRTPPLSWK
jgi:hypothetical protein